MLASHATTPLPLATLALSVSASELWILVSAVCCAVACALVGSFIVLRRMALLGDAISHAILPGLAVAFMLTGSRDPGVMLIGALVVGVLTAILTQAVSHWGRVGGDTAMGVVFSSLFALGVVLITRVARDVDLDPGCVLYGNLEFIAFNKVTLLGQPIPHAMVPLGVVLFANLAFVTLLFKELKLVAFDAALATTMGISAGAVHYLLMSMVAATCVASFEAVGSILVVSMLVTPPATAYLLTDRLSRMLILAALIAAACAIVGTFLAIALNVTIAGTIAALSGIVFALAVLFAPAHGILAKALRRARLSIRIAREDLLGELYRAEERRVPAELASLYIGQSPWIIALAERSARRMGLAVRESASTSFVSRSTPNPAPSTIDTVPGTWRLTEAGREAARSIIRSHRLWESYLHTHTTLPLDHLHEPSHRVEHFLTPELQGQLAQELTPSCDPHGAAIPPPSSSTPTVTAPSTKPTA